MEEGALDGVADELYGLAPEDFTAARDARAAELRGQGRRDEAGRVKALRRPAVAAWLVNALVRHRPDEVDQLLELGATMRQAQAEMDADQLRELGRQRQALIAAVGRQARALARELGRPVTDPAVDAVEETLRAALADSGAADAVRTGRLTTPLSYAGFGEVDLTGALATPGQRPLARRGRPAATEAGGEETAAPPEAGADEGGRRRELERRLADARAAAEEARLARVRAEGSARRARQHQDAVTHRAAAARERVDAAAARVEELEQVLAGARDTLARARAGWTPLQAEADAAAASVDEALAAADRARDAEAAARAAEEAAGEELADGRR